MIFLLVIILLFSTHQAVCLQKNEWQNSIYIISEDDLRDWFVVDQQVFNEGTTAQVQIVSNGKDLFLVKQIINNSLEKQFSLILDCIASTIGRQNNIPVNQVFFIPYDVGSHIKKDRQKAATLHDYIPARSIKNIGKISSHFTLCQKQPRPEQDNYVTSGLTKKVIESMALHADLAMICALDTFCANSDRRDSNILYDKVSHAFYGIDQANSFNNSSSAQTCDTLTKLQRQKYFNDYSTQILTGVQIYKQTLQHLCSYIIPEAIVMAIHNLVPHLAPLAQNNLKVKNELIVCERAIYENYTNVLKIIAILDSI